MADANGRLAHEVGVSAPPESGRANQALIKLLAKSWKHPTRDLTIVSGHKDRNKVLLIHGDSAELAQHFKGWLKSQEFARPTS